MPHRAVLQLEGADTKPFLQGLITNDIHKLNAETPLYACLLSPQGKYLFDFFLVQRGDSILLDVTADRAEALQKRLTMYKLRSDVRITPRADLQVYVLNAPPTAEGIFFPDPRHKALGIRALLTPEQAAALPATPRDMAAYDTARIRLGIPESGIDLLPEESFPLHHRMEALHAVDFNKGCYVGQEVTARSKHRGALRKTLYVVEAETALPAPGTAITLEGKPAGTLHSVQGNVGLALLEIEKAAHPALRAGNTPLTAHQPQ
ncbi:MAG: folate-binding protein YgfZ [Hyphomicrobiales bacterium]|nr:folate-binding protein YgfZ [Hyphomicrobiales bacterium]